MKMKKLSGCLPWLFPDTKAQVTIEYRSRANQLVPLRIVSVVVTAQHDQSISIEKLRASIRQHVLQDVLPPQLVDNSTTYHVSLQ